MNSIIIHNCNCLDPQHGIMYEPRDLFIEGGFFKASDTVAGTIEQELDAANKIVVPGGIFPSLKMPIPVMGHVEFRPKNIAKILARCGFTTVVMDSISPFIALDTHRYLGHLPGMNKVPFIDVGNYQFMAGFLKNGVANYAAALEDALLDKFKGFGVSCMNPGIAVRWKNEIISPRSMFEPLPFLGMSPEKIISELAGAHAQFGQRPALVVETGIEGLPSSSGDFTTILETAWNHVPDESRDHANPAIAFKQLSRASCNADKESGEIGSTVQKLQASLQGYPGITGFMDIPSITSNDAVYIDGSNSWLQASDAIIARGMIEGEMFQSMYHVVNDEKKEILGKYWLAGTRFLVDLPAELHDAIGFSMMPWLIRDVRDIMDVIGSLLSVPWRNSVMERTPAKISTETAEQLLGDKVISLPDFVNFSRVVPARLLYLEKYIGGLADGQVGDAIILDAEESDLDAIMNDPSRLEGMLGTPLAVIKAGNVIFKNNEFDFIDKEFTFLQSSKEEASITGSIKENLDKQFLKYYSTHENSKVVPESMIEPVLKT